ncbi:MAG: hypothetical protein HY865_22590 [Chloroflexi bacterium]|nr:hypothetical protein [Chloroflexota bacterium]
MEEIQTPRWPAWRYSPDGKEARIFEREEDAPKGWLDHQVSSEEEENEAVANTSVDENVQTVDTAVEDATSPVKPSSKKKSSNSKKK